MSRTRFSPGQWGALDARNRAFHRHNSCTHVWEHRPWDVFPYRCARCGSWSKREEPMVRSPKGEVDRGGVR